MGAMNARGSKRRAAERNASVATSPQDLAAGALVWRRAANGEDVEFGVVHRPRYDDWSFPKGKADPGEHPLVCATREVAAAPTPIVPPQRRGHRPRPRASLQHRLSRWHCPAT